MDVFQSESSGKTTRVDCVIGFVNFNKVSSN